MKKYLLLLIIAVFAASCGDKDGERPTTYTVTFESNGGSEVKPITGVRHGSKIVSPTDPTKNGYTFVGWFIDDETFAERWDFETQTVTEDVTLYAKWLYGSWIDGIFWAYVSTAAQLDAVRNNLAGNYLLMNDISLAEYDNWDPIGRIDNRENVPFTGTLNGNGYKITDLTINRSEDIAVGLFGSINGGFVINLGVEIGAGGINGGAYAGGIAGGVSNGKISNCYSTGNISSDGSVYHGCAGGIIGDAYNSTITYCHSTGNITATTTFLNSYSGGIAGYVNNCAINGCYSAGYISSTSDSSLYKFSHSGGIAGYVSDRNSLITNCYSIGDIYSSVVNISEGRAYSGGIVGYAVVIGAITNCYSTGNTSASSDHINSFTYSGGIAGAIGNDSVLTNCAAINHTIDAYCAGRLVGMLFVGNINLTVSNNFASNAMTATGAGQFDTTDERYYGISKTLSELQTRATYETGLGWDFTNTWKMPASGSGFPIFQWQ